MSRAALVTRDLRMPPPVVAVREPLRIPRRRQQTFEEALIAVGIVPRNDGRGRHGLVWRWFAAENGWLLAGNVAASVVLLSLALTMTGVGIRLAVTLGVAGPIYDILNDALPYAGLALMAAAALKGVHAHYARRATLASRGIGFALAGVMLFAGLWLEAMLGYANVLPWMFKPVLALAGGDATARVAAFDTALVAYFEPALAALAAMVLGAKLIRSAVLGWTSPARKRGALTGVALCAAVLLISTYATWRHASGSDTRDGIAFAIGGETLADTDHGYGALFAAGVPCHVSSLYGWRDDPLSPGRQQHHQGVDLAVKEGTPVHAMADGRILFADSDEGLGNFVALQVGGRDNAPTIVNGHMQTLLVHAGDFVHRGDVIGLAGSTGRSTGPHVHLQICSGAHTRKGGFVCGGTSNPYENWPTLSALTHMSCAQGPALF